MRLGPAIAVLGLALFPGCKKDPIQLDDTGRADDTGDPLDDPGKLTLTVTNPDRGSFQEDPDVDVTGRVTTGEADLDYLTLNDAAVSLDGNGNFSVAYDGSDGINLLGIDLQALDGERIVDGRAFYGGETHAPRATLNRALYLHIGKDMLDDDAPDVDDMATLAEIVIESDDLEDLIVGQTYTFDASVTTVDVTPTYFSLGPADVDIKPLAGKLDIDLSVEDLAIDLYVWPYASWLPDFSVGATATQLDVGVDVRVDDAGRVTVSNTSAILTGLDIEYVPFGEDYIAGYIEDIIEEQVAAILGDVVEEYLGALAVDVELVENVTLKLDIDEIDVTTAGISLYLDASFDGDAIGLPPNAGSLLTRASGPSWPPSSATGFAVAVDDDLANQALFAMWGADLLSDIRLTEGLGGLPLGPPLGPIEAVEINLDLPPVLRPDGGAGLGVLQVGELLVDLEREDGQSNVLAVGMTTRVGLLVDGSEIGLQLYSNGETEVVVGPISVASDADGAQLASLGAAVLPLVIQQANGGIPTFSIPELDLEALTGFRAFRGIHLSLQNLTYGSTTGSWIDLRGRLAE